MMYILKESQSLSGSTSLTIGGWLDSINVIDGEITPE